MPATGTVVTTGRQAKEPFLRGMGIEVDIRIDDDPARILAHHRGFRRTLHAVVQAGAVGTKPCWPRPVTGNERGAATRGAGTRIVTGGGWRDVKSQLSAKD